MLRKQVYQYNTKLWVKYIGSIYSIWQATSVGRSCKTNFKLKFWIAFMMERINKVEYKRIKQREPCLMVVHIVKKKSIIVGKLDLLLLRRRIGQFAVLSKFLRHIFPKMGLVLFLANVIPDSFQKLTIHLRSLHNFRTHFQGITFFITIFFLLTAPASEFNSIHKQKYPSNSVRQTKPTKNCVRKAIKIVVDTCNELNLSSNG